MLSKLSLVAALVLLGALASPAPLSAQKHGGTMRMYIWDNPPNASIHEEATVSTVMPFMALFNYLVLYDQLVPLNADETRRPELATSWWWDESKTRLSFKQR